MYDDAALLELRATYSPVVLTGIVGSIRGRVAAERLTAHEPTIWIDALQYADIESFAEDLAAAVIRLILEDQDPRASREAALRLSTALSPEVSRWFALGARAPAPLLKDVLAVIPSEAALVIANAERLTERWADRALWALRAHLQESGPARGADGGRPQFRLVLLSRPWHVEELTGPRGPFFGLARSHVLEPPSDQAWHLWLRASGSRLSPGEIDPLLRFTRSIPHFVHEIVGAGDGDYAERRAIALRVARGRATVVLRAARAVHPIGPALLLAIAKGAPPYPAARASSSKTVSSVLRGLRDAEVIYPPGPRRWLVADPLVAHHLAAMTASRVVLPR